MALLMAVIAYNTTLLGIPLGTIAFAAWTCVVALAGLRAVLAAALLPAAFAEDGTMGIFESNSIMRLAALTGPNAPALYGDSAAARARIDGFLDKTLLFADIIQKYILSGDALDAAMHGQMAAAFQNYCAALELALGNNAHVSGDMLSLSDVVLVCELALMSNESRMADNLAAAELTAILPELKNYPALFAHVTDLLSRAEFAEDLAGYARHIIA